MKQMTEWSSQLDRWLEPFLEVLGDKRRRKWAPLYLMGLLLPGERKSMEPISERVAPDDIEQIHHFVSTSRWDPAPLEEVLSERKLTRCWEDRRRFSLSTTQPAQERDRVGWGCPSVLRCSRQAGQLPGPGVGSHLSRDEIPAAVGLRLYLPKAWARATGTLATVKVPHTVVYKTEVAHCPRRDRSRENVWGALSIVLATLGTVRVESSDAAFERSLHWAVGSSNSSILCRRTWDSPIHRSHTPPKARAPSRCRASSVGREVHSSGWNIPYDNHLARRDQVSAIVRVRPADGPDTKEGVQLPGDAAWLVRAPPQRQ